MGWSIGYDDRHKRDIGYGVPAICDHPRCEKAIHRGLAFVCGGEPFGGDAGCGLHFCSDHLFYWKPGDPQRCNRCLNDWEPHKPTRDTREWLLHKIYDVSWAQWRREHPDEVREMRRAIRDNDHSTPRPEVVEP